MDAASESYCLLHDCEFISRCPYWHEGDPVGVAELEPGRPKQENLYVASRSTHRGDRT